MAVAAAATAVSFYLQDNFVVHDMCAGANKARFLLGNNNR